MSVAKHTYPEFSGALQQRTTIHIKRANEVVDATNVDFGAVLGAMTRRAGAQGSALTLPKLPVDRNTLGAFIARFPAGAEVWAANNAADDLTAVLKRWVGPGAGTWSDVRTGMLAGAEVNMTDDNDEVWVSSYVVSSDTIGDPFTVDSAHSVSTTRQLQFSPKARFYQEFNGAIWAANCLVGGVRYRDRLYKSSGLTGVITFARSAQTLTQTASAATVFSTPLDVDSVRYLKATMPIEIYAAGTSTLLYSLTITSVDNALDTVSFTPDTTTFAAADITTATDTILVPTNTWLTSGLPATFWGGGTDPGGLVSGGVYYVIRVDATHVKLASSRANALAGTPVIDITTQGVGTHRLTFALVVGNKDEIWAAGRKGKLTRFWNTDYRNPEDSDYTKLPPTLDANNDITAVGALAGRMFIFTENSTIRFDGLYPLVLKRDVGCISARTIVYYDSFMAWLDAKGQVWLRNEEAGTMDVISVPVQKAIKKFTQDQLKLASAVCVGFVMKLTLGVDSVTGKTIRLTYNFQSNMWSKEAFTPQMPIQLEYKYLGEVKPHFFDEHGQFWVDEQGDDDNGSLIPFDVELGDDTFAAGGAPVDEIKKFIGVKVYSKNSAATKVFVSVDGGDWLDVGEITKRVQSISFENPRRPIPEGTLFNMRFVNSASGDPVQVDKAVVSYTRKEDTFRATPK